MPNSINPRAARRAVRALLLALALPAALACQDTQHRAATAATTATPAPAAQHSAAAPAPVQTAAATQGTATTSPPSPTSAAAAPQQPADPTPPRTPLTAMQLFQRDAVPTMLECRDAGLGACYTPADVRAAYDVNGLINAGLDGKGQGVVIIVSFGSPTLVADVAAFSKAMGLPDAAIDQLYPLGTDFGDADQKEVAGWGGEATLDVEWVHAMAPAAHITVLVSPVAETEGVVGLPEMRQLVQYELDNHLGNVISKAGERARTCSTTPRARPNGRPGRRCTARRTPPA